VEQERITAVAQALAFVPARRLRAGCTRPRPPQLAAPPMLAGGPPQSPASARLRDTSSSIPDGCRNQRREGASKKRGPDAGEKAMTERVTHDPEKLWELIGDIRFAMFTTRSAEGVLHSRPMTTQNKAADEGGSL